MKSKGFRSRFEKKIAANLVTAKVPHDYERSSFVYYTKTNGRCNVCGSRSIGKRGLYTPDFEFPNGIFLEGKGKFTSKDRTKMIAMKEQHPSVEIRLLFMRDNKLNKMSKTHYSKWAEENGYKYHVSSTGTIPPQWLKEFKGVSSKKR